MGLGLAHKVFDKTNAMLALSSKLKFSAKDITHLVSAFCFSISPCKAELSPPKTDLTVFSGNTGYIVLGADASLCLEELGKIERVRKSREQRYAFYRGYALLH